MAGISKKTLRVSGIILFLILLLVLAFNSIVARIIEKKVNDFLLKENLKHFHVEYRRAGFNIINRSISLIGVRYLPDSAYLDSLDKAEVDKMVPSITIKRITVSGLHFFDILNRNKLVIRKITIKNPEVVLYKFVGKHVAVSPQKIRKMSVNDSIKLVKLSGVSVNTISLKRCRLEIVNYKKRKTILSSSDIYVLLHGLSLEKSGHDNGYFYPSLRGALLRAGNNVFKLADNLYEIAFQKLYIDLKGQTIQFSGFHYQPVYSKKEFSQHIKYQKERFDFMAKKIDVSGADFFRFLTSGKINIRKITVSDANIDLFRDKNVPFNHLQRPLLPNEMLKKMKGKLAIDTVQIIRTRFEYSETSKLTKKPLVVFFSDMSAEIFHLSDIPYLWRKNNMQVNFKGRLMGKAPFYVRFVFPLISRADTFYFRGAIYGPVRFTVFNPAVFPAAGLKFDGGILEKLTFKGSANPHFSVGTMTVIYHDLELEAMKKKNRKEANKFTSWGINSFVRKNNPRKGEGKKPKTVSMFFHRDIEKGFGNFFWKTLYSGMKATMLPSINTVNRKNAKAVTDND